MGISTIMNGGLWDLSFFNSTTFWAYLFWVIWYDI